MNRRVKDRMHLDFIRQLPCLNCGNNIATEAAHIRGAAPRAGKRPTGMGEKPDDAWTVPLCGECHLLQHQVGERDFWGACQMDAIFVALALYRASGDHEAGEQIISSAQSTGMITGSCNANR